MKFFQVKFAGAALVAATVGTALGGCAGGANYHVQDIPATTQPYRGSPAPRQALADEVYLDGTGPSARRLAGEPDQSVETLRVTPPADGPAHAVVRSRPTAIPRNDDISARTTTGSRTSTAASGEANKPFTKEWWEKERREDARLRDRMNICRGC